MQAVTSPSRFSESQLFCLSFLIFIMAITSSCSLSDNNRINEDFLKKSEESLLLYFYGNVDVAKYSMEKFEEYLLEFEHDAKLYGIKTREDYLYSTRLRLWGIAFHLSDGVMKSLYEQKLSSMNIVSNGDLLQVSDESLLAALEKLDGNWKPIWLTGQSPQEPREKISVKEMIDKGWIKRVD